MTSGPKNGLFVLAAVTEHENSLTRCKFLDQEDNWYNQTNDRSLIH